MTFPASSHSREPLSEELDNTEPEFWLDDLDVVPVDETGGPALFDAKTEPARPVGDELHDTLPGVPYPMPDPSREQALLTFLETVRRVFAEGPR